MTIQNNYCNLGIVESVNLKLLSKWKVAVSINLIIVLVTAPVVMNTDSDGLSITEEISAGSNPFNADTDGDGLSDYEEIERYDTNPNAQDTDGDGLDDQQELKIRTDPTESDTDSDGLNDMKEQKIGTDARTADTDSDGLEDGREIRIGSDPFESDTDNDGLTDSYEVQLDKSLDSEVDPAKRTLLLEIDYDEGNKPTEETLNLVRETFENAPISNHNGEDGIDVVFVVDDELQLKEDVSLSDYKADDEEIYDRRNQGFYHVVIVDNVGGFRSLYGVTDYGINGVLVQDHGNPRVVASIMIHEIGHQLGLMPEDYSGIDSNIVPYDEYPSAMNYNSGLDSVKLSDGEGFDDWAHIRESMDENAPPVNGTEYKNQTDKS